MIKQKYILIFFYLKRINILQAPKTMTMKLLTRLLVPLFLILISVAYYEIILDLKRNSQIVLPQRYKEIHSYESNKSEKTIHKQRNKSLELVQNGIFWSDYAESLIPKGMLFRWIHT